MSVREKIIEIAGPKLEELGCFLVDVKVNPAFNKYEVFIDTIAGVTIEECQKLSRFIEFTLDNDPAMPKQYSLDVSSPGMENPFKVHQQFEKNIGKTVEVVLLSGVKLEGVMTKADGKVLHLEVHHIPKKKGMKPEITMETIDFDEIKGVKKKISF